MDQRGGAKPQTPVKRRLDDVTFGADGRARDTHAQQARKRRQIVISDDDESEPHMPLPTADPLRVEKSASNDGRRIVVLKPERARPLPNQRLGSAISPTGRSSVRRVADVEAETESALVVVPWIDAENMDYWRRLLRPRTYCEAEPSTPQQRKRQRSDAIAATAHPRGDDHWMKRRASCEPIVSIVCGLSA